MTKYMIIDLYTNDSQFIDYEEFLEAIIGLDVTMGVYNVWKGEEYMVIEIK